MSQSYKNIVQSLAYNYGDAFGDNINFCLKYGWVTTLKHVSQVHTAGIAK